MSHSPVTNLLFLLNASLVTPVVSSGGTTKARGRLSKVTRAPGVRKKCRNVKTTSVVRITRIAVTFSANKHQASPSRLTPVFSLFSLVEEDEGDDAGDSSEGWSDIDTSETYEETTTPPADVVNEDRGDVPPPSTTEVLVQPVGTTDPTTTTITTTASTMRAATTTSTTSTVQGPKVTAPPATSEPATRTPRKHEAATKIMDEQEEKVKRTTRPVGQEVKTDEGLDRQPTRVDTYPKIQRSRGSTLVPSLLVACVSSIFSLRL